MTFENLDILTNDSHLKAISTCGLTQDMRIWKLKKVEGRFNNSESTVILPTLLQL